MTETGAPLWTLAEIVAATDGRLEGAADAGLPLSSVSIDSRTLEPGALFVAIRGDRLDGHAFVDNAFAAGAACALVAEGADSGTGQPVIRVGDTLRALEQLGMAARARCDARVIAVTGSVGKTGTKEALRLALGETGPVHASQKSYNNLWGVPLSLATMPREARFGVFEIGMNHAGEIEPLTKMVRPHIAIITTVAAVHLEFFDSVDGIAEAKAEILIGLEPGGTAILNRDNAYFGLLKRRAEEAGAGRVIAFGEHRQADARLLEMAEGTEGSQARADIGGETVAYRIGAPGKHLVMNSLAVLAAVQAAGGDIVACAGALERYQSPQGRGARTVFTRPDGDIVLIDESYNANPASMRAALAALGASPRGQATRRIAVLGDMLELGADSEDMHRALAGPVDAAGVDVVFACGPHMRALFESLPEACRGGYAESSEGLKETLLETVRPGDVVMIKGSLGSRMGLLVDALRETLSR